MRITPEQAPTTYTFLAVDFPAFFLDTAVTDTNEEWSHTIEAACKLINKYKENDFVKKIVMTYLDHLDQISRDKRKRERAAS